MHIISSMEVELFVFRKEAQIDYISVTLGFFFKDIFILWKKIILSFILENCDFLEFMMHDKIIHFDVNFAYCDKT